jgi:hypothetical protein
MIEYRKDKLAEINMVFEHATNHPGFAYNLNIGLRLGQRSNNINDYLDLLEQNRANARMDLHNCLEVIQRFRDQVMRAFGPML